MVKVAIMAGGLALLALGGCASMGGTGAPAAPAETISYSVGPCFGFCPVYSVEITPDGTVRYTGERHTAVLGGKELTGQTGAYKAMLKALAPYRPATGQTADTECEQQVSDLQHYRIVWKAADGTETVLQHNQGCRSEKNDALNKALQSLPAKLGIADWAKAEHRPGVSRG